MMWLLYIFIGIVIGVACTLLALTFGPDLEEPELAVTDAPEQPHPLSGLEPQDYGDD